MGQKLKRGKEANLKFIDGSPESIFTRFMMSWKKRDVKGMLDMCSPSWIAKRAGAKEKLELWFGEVELIGTQILKVKEPSESGTDLKIIAKIAYRKKLGIKKFIRKIKCSMVCERKAFDKNKNGRWRVVPITIFLDLVNM